MKKNKEAAYIFCTPFLDEIDRIRNACGRNRFKEPVFYNGPKIDDFNNLLTDGCCVAVTHVTFLNATHETLDRIREGEYTLILDEVLDVVVDFNSIQSVEKSPKQSVTKKDLQLLKEHNIIKVGADFRVEWCGGDYGNDFKFSEAERLAKMGVLYCVRDSLLVTVFPPEIFRLFRHVYVLTYLFDGSMLKYYFQLFGLEYELASVYTDADRYDENRYSIGTYTDEADKAFRQQFRNLVTICDDERLNRKRTLSKDWYKKATEEDLKRLRNDLGDYYNRYLQNAKASNGDIMWTCPVDYMAKIKGKGYTRERSITREEADSMTEAQHEELKKKLSCFVPCNSRATNIYRSRWALAYCYNMFLNPMIRSFFTDFNEERKQKNLPPIEPDDRQFALSCLLQWMCRSRIRDGQAITIYLPSWRMRSILQKWMTGGERMSSVEDPLPQAI